MPLFKRKDDHDEKLAELEAQVRYIREHAGTESDGSARTLNSFLMEDDRWLSDSDRPGAAQPESAPKAEPTATRAEEPSKPSEDEAMLVAELERYLSRIEEDTKPDANSGDCPLNPDDKRGDLSALS